MIARWAIITLLFISGLANAQPVKVEGPGPNWEWHQTDKQLGNVVVITVYSRYTERSGRQVNWELTKRLGGNAKFFTVIDFIGIPHFLFNFARNRIAKKMRGSIEVICDTTGKLRKQLNAEPRNRVDVVILDRKGEIRGHFNGIREIEPAIKLVNELTRE